MAEDTGTALMDVGEHAARSRGIDGFSYADLARAMGIRKASIRCHFPSKADLSQALVERYQTRLRPDRCRARPAERALPVGTG